MIDVLADVAVLETDGDASSVEVRGLELDSRAVKPGDLFCCVPGAHVDGHLYAADAVQRGAVGVLAERRIDGLQGAVVQVRVAPGTVRGAMAAAAVTLYGHPAERLVTAGITGTNAKTTVSLLLGAIFEAADWQSTVVGTLSGERTTPEAPHLQALLATAADRAEAQGRKGAVAMEVSSHALAQQRVEGVRFDVAVFTNLSQDHLDFHGSMEEYGAAKLRLFEPGQARQGVVNVDDPWGRRIASSAAIPVIGVSNGDATGVELAPRATAYTWRGRRVRLGLTGRINVLNALMAGEAALALGLDPDTVVAGLEALDGVPGRFELVAAPADGDPFTVLVDYAHTPHALEVALGEARALAAGARVLVVFGCGGDRDRTKRPEMGRVAARGADVAIVTSDNPRHEDPLAIIEAVVGGTAPGHPLLVEPDRRGAIALALDMAHPGDVVLLAGKGHETYQETGDVREPFDDRAVARALLDTERG
jgi:UDP-N-acetylmuramoyl-L-alanyl-D-glutamate--2,6-diaminopimelate ligase